MIKKIFIFLLLIISQFILWNSVFSASIPVEKVFLDIDKNYKFYNELQTLYDRWMIYPDANWKFNPKKLLNRDEFVWISMEVTCKRCISPNTDFRLLKEHSKTQTFFDVSKNNKNFYCIAESDKLWYVKWYDEWYKCEWKEKIDWKRPFCVDNKITLDEALAVLLRNSGIFTIEDNKKVLEQIYSWEIIEDLAEDVSVKNYLWQVYTFYWYIKKALEFQLKEVDKDWNEKIYKLLEKQNNKIYPFKHISKEEFLRIAYIALKSNSCIEDKDIDLSIKIKIFNKECSEWSKCENIIFDPLEDTFDLDWIIWGVCEKWIDNKNYNWTFYNIDNWDEVYKKGKYIDNYKFLSEGKWRIILKVKDNCGNKAEAYSTIFIKVEDNKWLNVQIEADPMIWNVQLNVQFEGIVSWWVWEYKYEWNFKDWNRWVIKRPKNIFKTPWIYEVVLLVTDEDWNTWEASVVIKVLDFDSCTIDADGDWIMDCDDKCPTVKWDIKNNGCPILEEKCWNNCSCSNWYECTNNNPKVCQSEWVCIPKKITLNNCLEKGFNSFIYGNSACNICPCDYSLDFISTIRRCDLVFPAITSPDSKNIYSRWKIYKIK